MSCSAVCVESSWMGHATRLFINLSSHWGATIKQDSHVIEWQYVSENCNFMFCFIRAHNWGQNKMCAVLNSLIEAKSKAAGFLQNLIANSGRWTATVWDASMSSSKLESERQWQKRSPERSMTNNPIETIINEPKEPHSTKNIALRGSLPAAQVKHFHSVSPPHKELSPAFESSLIRNPSTCCHWC